jgi:hypothetical protein
MKIKLKDYERIYKTINSIVINENEDPTVSCTFFSFYGAHILREHYKMDAYPVAGMCFYHIGGDNSILSFAKLDGDNFSSDTDAFHCWVVVDDWLIDFMAPAFSDIKTGSVPIKAKMMQKPLSAMVSSISDLTKEGDFYFEANTEVFKNRKEYLNSSLTYSDLSTICSQWYKKPPKKMNSMIQIGDSKGHLNSIFLQGNSITETW